MPMRKSWSPILSRKISKKRWRTSHSKPSPTRHWSRRLPRNSLISSKLFQELSMGPFSKRQPQVAKLPQASTTRTPGSSNRASFGSTQSRRSGLLGSRRAPRTVRSTHSPTFQKIVFHRFTNATRFAQSSTSRSTRKISKRGERGYVQRLCSGTDLSSPGTRISPSYSNYSLTRVAILASLGSIEPPPQRTKWSI